MKQRAADFVAKIFAAHFTRWRNACCKLLYAISWGGMNYAESMQHSADCGFIGRLLQPQEWVLLLTNSAELTCEPVFLWLPLLVQNLFFFSYIKEHSQQHLNVLWRKMFPIIHDYTSVILDAALAAYFLTDACPISSAFLVLVCASPLILAG